MKIIPQHIIRQIFILLLILSIAGLILWKLLPYLSGVLGAITFYVLLRKFMVRMVRKGLNPSFSAFTLCLLSFIVILVPVSGVLMLLGNKVGSAVTNSEKVIKAVKGKLGAWESQLGYDITSQIDVKNISEWISQNLQDFAGGTFNVFIAIGLMYFILYYLLIERSSINKNVGHYIPVNEKNLRVIGNEVKAMVRSNALGIPLVALAQGVVALIGFLIFGVQDPFFWFVIVTIGSMIPFVGTALGIIPVFILEMSSGNTFTAWAILIYGFTVVGATDNLIRMYILRRLDNVHPLITLVGVIVGVPLFGFIGLIFGPLMISLFLVLLSIYRKEYPENEDA